jgi:hypothetical protein
VTSSFSDNFRSAADFATLARNDVGGRICSITGRCSSRYLLSRISRVSTRACRCLISRFLPWFDGANRTKNGRHKRKREWLTRVNESRWINPPGSTRILHDLGHDPQQPMC